MLAALRQGYSSIFEFRGRMAIGPFWIYAGFNLTLVFVAWTFAFVSVFQEFVGNASRVAQTHPQDIFVHKGTDSLEISVTGDHPNVMPDMTGIIGILTILALFFFLVTVAAAVRRLHDSGRNGIWVLLPIPFLLISFGLGPDVVRQFSLASAEPDFGRFALLFANNLIYLLCILVLGVLLGLPGSQLENRFGPPPNGKMK